MTGLAQEPLVANGIPTWVMTPTPANALIQPAIWTGRAVYRTGENAQDFISFSVNQPSYVYIVHINALGKAELLLPNQNQIENFFNAGQHRFTQEFILPREEGIHYLQIVASPLSLTLGKESAEIFPVLGTSPLEARKSILAQLHARQLASGEWGSSWTHYETAPAAPVSADSFGQVIVRVVDGDCSTGQEIRDAAVYRDEDKIPFVSFTPVTALKGSHLFRAEALGYRPKTAPARVAGTGIRELCISLPRDTSIRGKAYFTFSPAPRANDNVIFDASRSRGLLYEWDFGDGAPIATGERVGHSFAFSGTFLVKLKVQFFDGESEVVSVPVNVRSGEACFAATLPTTLPACQGGRLDKETLTLEARDSRHVNLVFIDQALNNQDARMRFDVFVDLVPELGTVQTVSTQIESYLQFDLFDKSGARLDTARSYTLNTRESTARIVLPGQSQSLTLTLQQLFGINALAKAGRIRVSAVLNTQNSLTSVKIRYRLVETNLTTIAGPTTTPSTTTTTTPPEPSEGGGDMTLWIVLGLVALVAVVAIILLMSAQ
jgi:hypothetical protein